MDEAAHVIHVSVFAVTGDLLVAADLPAGSSVKDLKRVVAEECGVCLAQQRIFNNIGEMLGNEELLNGDASSMSVSLAVVVDFTFTPDRIFDVDNDGNLFPSSNMRVAAEHILTSMQNSVTVAVACEPLSPGHGVFSAIYLKSLQDCVYVGVARLNESGKFTEKPVLWDGLDREITAFGPWSWMKLPHTRFAEGDVLTLQRRHGQLLGAINGQCVVKDGCPVLADNLGLSDDIYPLLGFYCRAGAEWQALSADDPRNYDVEWPESA